MLLDLLSSVKDPVWLEGSRCSGLSLTVHWAPQSKRVKLVSLQPRLCQLCYSAQRILCYLMSYYGYASVRWLWISVISCLRKWTDCNFLNSSQLLLNPVYIHTHVVSLIENSLVFFVGCWHLYHSPQLHQVTGLTLWYGCSRLSDSEPSWKWKADNSVLFNIRCGWGFCREKIICFVLILTWAFGSHSNR